MTGSIKFVNKSTIRILNVDPLFFQKTTIEKNGRKMEITPREKAETLAHDLNATSFELTSDKKSTKYTRTWDEKRRKFSYTVELG